MAQHIALLEHHELVGSLVDGCHREDGFTYLGQHFRLESANVKMFIFVPNTVRTIPAVVFAINHLRGTVQSFYGSSPYARLADQHVYRYGLRHGFVIRVINPSFN